MGSRSSPNTTLLVLDDIFIVVNLSLLEVDLYEAYKTVYQTQSVENDDSDES